MNSIPATTQYQSNGLRNLAIAGALFAVLILVVAMLGKSSNRSRITTYEQRTKSIGSHTLESYPTICVTKDGQTSTDTSQQRHCQRVGMRQIQTSADSYIPGNATELSFRLGLCGDELIRLPR